jgi:rod shape-determining protein MreD
MKPYAYLLILLLIVPVQAALLNPLSLGGIKPDLSLVLIYIIGLLTGPLEASLAGITVGLVQDMGTASLIGMHGFTRGLIGLGAGFVGRGVLNIASGSNIFFVAGFSLVEGIVILIFIQFFYETVPFFNLLMRQLIPQAIYTGLLSIVLLRFINRKKVMTLLMRRSLLKE